MSAGKARSFAFSDEGDDPFALEHISEHHDCPPIESTYRNSGGNASCTSNKSGDQNDMRRIYVHDDDRVLIKVVHFGHPTSVGIEIDDKGETYVGCRARRAGPRAWIYFQPETVRAAIVTCGGLCPGLNDVIRQTVFSLEVYGVKEILGLQYGFRGFADKKYPPIMLSRKIVQRINMVGGSFLGVSRGCPPLDDIVDKLEWKISMFFVIGGNGSHAGASAIYEKCQARKLKMVVVGIPKTIDNDIQILDKTFGFDTAVEEAQRAINAAYIEASSAYNGVGIVKLMGRQSGYITMYATIASGQVDIVLIPEVPFLLDTQYGVLEYMKKRLEQFGICVVVIAEGAGQDLLEGVGGTDASGNPILGDVGKWFYGKVKAYFASIKFAVDVKYIDPTYMIRARACNSSDHIFCSILGQNAVHGAFAGYTNVTVGVVNTHYCFLPIPEVIRKPRMVDPNSNMYHRCVTSTGQPEFQIPTCTTEAAGGKSSSGGWSAAGGSKAVVAPHGPPERKKSLSLKLDMVASSKLDMVASSGDVKSCESSSSVNNSCKSSENNKSSDRSITSCQSDGQQMHDANCPMAQHNIAARSKCHDPMCPVTHKY
ncbi:unnamed protein product [Sphagnum troendelagicum]|uniref:Phosphofructokinase domain-containing protein n=1 Tax=Sphagnum troendelagicum TaxID=128251 RepID=A0ABP0U6F1_9BRYO